MRKEFQKSQSNKQLIHLLLSICVLFAGLFLVTISGVSEQAPDYSLKYEASERTEKCFAAIREARLARGLPISKETDVNETGLIGSDYSFITTTLGDLPAKRTTTNPNMAAIIVDMMDQLSLTAGDRIAVNCSGSFPALNTAVLCAADTLGLDPIVISSFGASSHGANDPDFTWLDMEHELYSRGLIGHKSSYFSIGGNLDIGTEMPDEIVQSITKRIEGYGYPLIYDEDLKHNILSRYALYNSGKPVKCFINVGGNDASFGDSIVMVHAAGGILTELSEHDNSTGLVQLFLADDIPVIHLLNIKSIAADYQMPFDPVPLPDVGEGSVYYETRYSKPLICVFLLISIVLLSRLYFAKNKTLQ
ncbi:MAG: poly-gamma-glutamate system protein [Eubacteriales bacterium]|nr:poly-gamma-glutamate system protein [Eubacteriales bacterium]